MNNADMPAMPIELNGFGQYAPEAHCGLTKRETFAMNAPDMPSWFVDIWTNENSHVSRFFSESINNGVPCINLTAEGAAAIFIEWRTYYADALLKELTYD